MSSTGRTFNTREGYLEFSSKPTAARVCTGCSKVSRFSREGKWWKERKKKFQSWNERERGGRKYYLRKYYPTRNISHTISLRIQNKKKKEKKKTFYNILPSFAYAYIQERLSLSLSLSPFNVDEFSLLLLHCKTFWKSWNLGNWKPRFFSLELCRWLLVYDLRRICEIYASLTRFYKLKTHKFLFFSFFFVVVDFYCESRVGCLLCFFYIPFRIIYFNHLPQFIL